MDEKLFQELCNSRKEALVIKFIGDWLVVQKNKRNKRVNYDQGKSLSNNAPRDPGSSKIKGIFVSLKRISIDKKIVGPYHLDKTSKKWRFDKSGPTPEARHLAPRGDPRAKVESSFLEPHLAISGSSYKTGKTFNSH